GWSFCIFRSTGRARLADSEAFRAPGGKNKKRCASGRAAREFQRSAPANTPIPALAFPTYRKPASREIRNCAPIRTSFSDCSDRDPAVSGILLQHPRNDRAKTGRLPTSLAPEYFVDRLPGLSVRAGSPKPAHSAPDELHRATTMPVKGPAAISVQ